MSTRVCKYAPDRFCYVCGKFINEKEKRVYPLRTSKTLRDAYEAYFGFPIANLEKLWVPHFACKNCGNALPAWYRGARRCLQFKTPRIWTEPFNHQNDCYFCLADVSERKKGKGKSTVYYPDIPSSTAPIFRQPEDAIPIPPSKRIQDDPMDVDDANDDDTNDDDTSDDDTMEEDPSYESHDEKNSQPLLFDQAAIDDLAQKFTMNKDDSEVLSSHLKDRGLTDKSVKITSHRHRDEKYSKFFKTNSGFSYCSDVDGLFRAMGLEHKPDEWRLFIDGCTKSLKAVLLHNGNQHPSIPIAYSSTEKENYETMKKLLKLIKYRIHNWDIIGDFKVIGILMGIQSGNTAHPCFLCLWPGRNRTHHYKKRKWPPRKTFVIGEHNCINKPLVHPSKIILPPLHIKLGLIKQFICALDNNSDAFKYLHTLFNKLSDDKIKNGILVGPQVKKLMESSAFRDKLPVKERAAFDSFCSVVHNFLGNHRADNYAQIVKQMVANFNAMQCNMSLKVHVLHDHLDRFTYNLGDYSEEHGERAHQDMKLFEDRYMAKKDKRRMMGEYVWHLQQNRTISYKRQARKKICFK